MRSNFLAPLAALLSLSAAQASPVLLAHGSLSATSSDLSGLSGALENGAPGNLLGGFGSGLGYAGGGTFVAVPDRGPNAISYNPLIDDTASYIDRFQTFKLQLTPSSGALPYTLTPVLTATTLLSSATPLVYGTGALGTGTSGGNSYTLGSGVPALNAANNTYYFTGRSDGFDPSKNSLNPANARFDPESIRVSNDGKSVFISDEYGPSIYQFDRSTGQRIRTFTLPDYFGVQNVSSRGSVEISGNTQGRLANKGMEGLALTPDGKTLVCIVQSPLIQDGGAAGVNLRIVTIDIATGAVTHAYVYKLSNANNTVSDITAVNDHQFLVDERGGNSGLSAVTKQLFLIDVSGATDVKGDTTLPANFTAVAKGAQPFLDLLDPAYGLKTADFPQKIEGVAFGD
ncbi:MAG TPA: esterase-like activity of phytase family protein, partial [Bryobacteraceae bacterium]|nr:esterase-like activity of phytase family protein [Bryobacteraceae bacterium]